ncbi:methylmalonyl Co-A mutase-associated GTPase MeaB [Sneathiella sp. P13V-1]|uniref:methylmalonyl Co-A mutase-associated GTPase MeaB n=1 Tax=Sneathiella sp. P13V-1 TaxID=2697366 RepID=UPI00187B1F48|nr:methylmalonyl Co-A mutase-associated GTPase MeaB [Sneathiella sp. P13V-1]MBE7635627.1 methylmalonyl Co-A mutase-associated GTPase MeaB [Sneathiella sp. P13V-1]
MRTSLDDLVIGLRAGNRAALARAITLAENNSPETGALLQQIAPDLGRAIVVGFTGAPGAGKSTLVGAIVKSLRERGKTVGVIAVDPSSPLSGGAVLGDRIRMSEHSDDDGVFVRSLASRGHLGGLSRSASHVIDVMDAYGMDYIVLETVGAGQSEVEVADIADVKIVVCAPGLGDDVQAIKAGILEIADILVVNKADNPLAERTARQLEARTTGSMGRKVPVMKTIALEGVGLDDLTSQIETIAALQGNEEKGKDRPRKLLKTAAIEHLTQILERDDIPEFEELAVKIVTGEINFERAAAEALRVAAKKSGK